MRSCRLGFWPKGQRGADLVHNAPHRAPVWFLPKSHSAHTGTVTGKAETASLLVVSPWCGAPSSPLGELQHLVAATVLPRAAARLLS